MIRTTLHRGAALLAARRYRIYAINDGARAVDGAAEGEGGEPPRNMALMTRPIRFLRGRRELSVRAKGSINYL